MYRLDGRVVVVAGAGDILSIGHMVTQALLEAGATVAVLDVNKTALEESIPVLRESVGPNRVAGFLTDVADRVSASRSISLVQEELGGLDALVNCVGVHQSTLGPTAPNSWSVDPAVWDRIMSVNLTGTFNLLRAVLPSLISQGWGRIIGLTTSMSSMFKGSMTPYGPSKAGQEALLAATAEELQGSGVTCNVLVPGGPTRSRMTLGQPKYEGLPLINPAVMRDPALWLLSDKAKDFNGRRITALLWDSEAPLADRLAAASAPAAWPQAGQPAMYGDKTLVGAPRTATAAP